MKFYYHNVFDVPLFYLIISVNIIQTFKYLSIGDDEIKRLNVLYALAKQCILNLIIILFIEL